MSHKILARAVLTALVIGLGTCAATLAHVATTVQQEPPLRLAEPVDAIMAHPEPQGLVKK